MKQKKLFKEVFRYLSFVEPARQLVEEVEFLIEAIKEKPFKYGAVGITALLYFLSPVDAVPDLIPVAGLLDDAAVIAAAVSTIRRMMGI